jgi:hypothetical protein
MYHILITVGILMLLGGILFITLGLFGKISTEPFNSKKQYYAFFSIFLISGLFAIIRSQGVDCQIERYQTNLEHLSSKMMRSSLDCKMIGVEDLEKCPLMWEHYQNKEFYTKEIIRLTKLKNERNRDD